MSQGVIPLSAGGGGAAVRGKINDALQRLQTKGSGTARPSDIAAGEDWIETDNPGAGTWSWWLYDGTSDILLGTINSTTHALTWSNSIAASLLTTKGDLIKGGVSGTPARFGVGGALYGLHVNAAGDDLEWRRNGWEKIADDAVPSSAGSVDFTSIPSCVKHLRASFRLRPATYNVYLWGRISVAGSFKTSSYQSVLRSGASNAGASNIGSAAAAAIVLSDSTYTVSNSATYGGLSGVLEFSDLQNAAYPQATIQSSWGPDAGGAAVYWQGVGAGGWLGAGPVDGLRLLFSSGNIADGRVSLYGMRG